MAGTNQYTPSQADIDSAKKVQETASQLKQSQELTHEMNAANNPVNPQQDIAEVMQPIQQNLTFEDMYRQRWEKQYEEEKAREQKRIERERLGTGIAGLAATIGDMVRASEGAPVSQRDWQRIYDNLTAQERANINNYQVRMAKLREDARADRMNAANAEAKARAAAQQRNFDYFKWKIERDDKLSEAEKNRMLRYLLSLMGNETKENVAQIRTDGENPVPRGGDVTLRGNTYHFDTRQNQDNLYTALRAILTNRNNFVGVPSASRPILSVEDFAQLSPEGKRAVIEEFVNTWVADDEMFAKLPEGVRTKIEQLLRNYSKYIVNPSQQTQTPPTSQSSSVPLLFQPQQGNDTTRKRIKIPGF